MVQFDTAHPSLLIPSISSAQVRGPPAVRRVDGGHALQAGDDRARRRRAEGVRSEGRHLSLV